MVPPTRETPDQLARHGWSASLRSVLPAFVFTRLAVLAVGLVTGLVVRVATNPAADWSSWTAVAAVINRWDTGWYLNIVQNGYLLVPGAAQQNVAFYPLYPALVALVSRLTGLAPLLAGLIISLAAFPAALVYVERLAIESCRQPENARHVSWMLACYPYAVFFGAVYTEALLLLCLAACIYHYRHRQWVVSAAWGVLAGLTRPNGVLVSASLLVLVAGAAFAQDSRVRRWLAGERGSNALDARAFGWQGVAAALAPVAGPLLFSGYLWARLGEPLAWLFVQRGWGRGTGAIAASVASAANQIDKSGVVGTLGANLYDVGNGAAALFAISLAWPVTRAYGADLGLLVILNVLAPLATGGLGSVGRFTSVLFPLFFLLADRVPRRARTPLLVACLLAQGVCAALFFTRHPVE